MLATIPWDHVSSLEEGTRDEHDGEDFYGNHGEQCRKTREERHSRYRDRYKSRSLAVENDTIATACKGVTVSWGLRVERYDTDFQYGKHRKHGQGSQTSTLALGCGGDLLKPLFDRCG